MIRRTLLTVGAFVALAIVPAAASAAPPPSLEGETLISAHDSFPHAACQDAASPGGASFSTDGTATGPYPGTFTETGTLKFDPSTNAFSFNASYTITADDGTVITGTKTDLGSPDRAACAGDFQGVAFATAFGYSATIKTASGSFHDEGIGDVNNLNIQLVESFDVSTLGTPVPLAPTTASQCKQGGWKTYGTTFKNQGDCVSFVATGGRNPGKGS